LSPTETSLISVQLGAGYDQQEEGQGVGPSALFEGHWDSEEPGVQSIYATGEYDNYEERIHHESNVQVMSSRTFGEARNHLRAGWSYRRNDLYLGSPGNIVKRIHDEARVNNQLVTPIDDGVDGVYDLGFRRTSVDYLGEGPGSSLERDFTNRFSILINRADWHGDLAYMYNIEDREYSSDLILGRRQMLSATAGRRGWWVDSLHVHYSTQKLAFDSPDSLEQSDRDRLIHRVAVTMAQPVNDRTTIVVDALVVLDHLVYLESSRSADNRWNRVFRLKPSVHWKPARKWHQRASFEVLANYTAYDFEDPDNGTVRSSVLRRWSVADTLTMPLSRQIGGELGIRYDIEDRGSLLWERFAQEVSDELHAVYLSGSIVRRFWGKLSVMMGYRYQSRTEDRLDLDADGKRIRTRARSYSALGPFFHLSTLHRSPLRLELDAVLLNTEDSEPYGRDRIDRITLSFVHRW
jgi:hypothetical protein